ncbi:unnamed protein product [Ixodes pacificus]
MSSGRRIRPERAPAHRRNVQKLTWRNSHWLHSFPEEQRVASMTIADMSPALASRRVVLLCERQQYREAANLVTRLGQATFKAILPELPVEVFLDAVPQSLHLLEALYAKVFLSEGLNFSLKLLKPEALVFQMVRLFAQHADDSGYEQDYTRNRFVAAPVMLSSCKKLLKVIVLTEPRMRHQLSGRKKALERALEGLGQHGLVGASGGVLVHLHDALRAELDLLLHQLKVSAQKLDALAAQGPQRVSLSHGPAPTTASHQRQLSIRQGQVQERLIKNKTLLNALEPVDQAGLEGLLAVLRRRIQLDKDVLFQAGPPVPGCSCSPRILLSMVEVDLFLRIPRTFALSRIERTDPKDRRSALSGRFGDGSFAIACVAPWARNVPAVGLPVSPIRRGRDQVPGPQTAPDPGAEQRASSQGTGSERRGLPQKYRPSSSSSSLSLSLFLILAMHLTVFARKLFVAAGSNEETKARSIHIHNPSCINRCPSFSLFFETYQKKQPKKPFVINQASPRNGEKINSKAQ